MTGRPSIYTEELGELICTLIAEGKSLRSICLLEDMPNVSTVIKWLAKGDDGEQPFARFLAQYTKARAFQQDTLFDELLHIADDMSDDTIHLPDEGKPVANSARINRDRLRIDTRKWMLGRMNPKKYGEKQTTVHEDAEGNGLPIQRIEVVHVDPKAGDTD